MNSSAPSILPPRVWIPSTHQLCFYQFKFKLWHVEKTKINRKRGPDWPILKRRNVEDPNHWCSFVTFTTKLNTVWSIDEISVALFLFKWPKDLAVILAKPQFCRGPMRSCLWSKKWRDLGMHDHIYGKNATWKIKWSITTKSCLIFKNVQWVSHDLTILVTLTDMTSCFLLTALYQKVL